MAVKTNHRFTGINVMDDAGDLPIGGLTVCNNMYIYGGNLYTRPGAWGLLTSPESEPIWNPTPFVDVNGELWVVYAVGQQGSNTGVIKFTSGTPFFTGSTGNTSYPLYLGPTGTTNFQFDASTFRCVRQGLCLYFIANGNLYTWRITQALSPSTTAYYGNIADSMTAPTSPINAQITNIPFDVSTASQWTSGPNPSPSALCTVTSGSFTIAANNTITVSATTYLNQASPSYQIVYITDGTNGAHFTIQAKTGSVLYVSLLGESSDSVTGTVMGASASVYLGDGGLLGNPYFDWDGPQVGSRTEGVGAPWYQPNPPYVVSSNSPDYGPNSLSSSPRNLGTVNGLYHRWATLLDNPSDTIAQNVYSTPNATVSYPIPPTIIGSAGNGVLTKCASFTFTCWMAWQANNSSASINFTLIAVKSGSIIGVSPVQNLMPSNSSTGGYVTCNFNFTQTLAEDPDYYTLIAQSGPKNVAGSGVYFGGCSLIPVGGIPVISSPGNQLIEFGSPRTTIGGSWMVKNYSTPKDFTGVNIYGFTITSAVPISDLNFCLGFASAEVGGAATVYTTGTLQQPANATYLYTDITIIPPDVLAAVSYIYLIALQDIPIADFPATGRVVNIMSFGPIEESGNLSVNTLGQNYSPYVYMFDEQFSNGDFTLTAPLLSAGSPISNNLTPNGQFAVSSGIVPPNLNANTDYNGIYRAGGTYEDGLFRQVFTAPANHDLSASYSYTDLVIVAGSTNKLSSALRPFTTADVNQTLPITGGTGFNQGLYLVASVDDSNHASMLQVTNALNVPPAVQAVLGTSSSTGGIGTFGGDNLATDQSNPYVSWNHTTRTFIDNTPDSFLQFSNVLQFGRSNPPTGISEILATQDRIICIVGQQAWVSWALVDSVQNGCYFTVIDLNTDPEASIKGIVVPIGYGDNDNIQTGLVLGSQALFLKNRSAGILFGYDPTNFASTSYLVGSGIGAAGLRSAWVTGANGLYIAIDNVYVWGGDTPTPISMQIEPLLHPKGVNGLPVISPTYYKYAAGMYYDQRSHIFAPLPNYAPYSGNCQNFVDYVYDMRPNYGFWTVWQYATGMTSGGTLTGGNNGSGAFMGGMDGQLYTFALSKSFNDLAVDAANNLKITSASYDFTNTDVSQAVTITAGTGWTPGVYPIASTESNAAILTMSPAAVSSSGGVGTLSAGGDKATPSSAATPINYSAVSRGMGQEQQTYSPSYEFGEAFMQPSKLVRAQVQGTFVQGSVFTLSAWMDKSQANGLQRVFNVPLSGQRTYDFTIPDGIIGDVAFVGISGSTILQQSVRGFLADIEKKSSIKN